MNPAPLLFPTDFSRRFTLILTDLVKLIAHGFLHIPRYCALIVPLVTRLNRTRQRFERLLARLAAGIAPRPSRPRPGRPPRPAPERVGPALPTGRGWLVHALGYQAANYASQLQALLAEAADQLAQAPATGRILRPLKHMLAIGPATPRPRAPRVSKPRQPKPPRLLERVPRNWRKTWEWLRTPLPPEPA